MSKKAEVRKVAVIIETSTDYCRRTLTGIAEYLQTNQNLTVFLEQNVQNVSLDELLASNKWDGVIYRHADTASSKNLQTNGVPAVILTDTYETFPYPVVVSDHRAIGTLGAHHLIECGLPHFAYCGFSSQNWSHDRNESFCQAVAEIGGICEFWESPLLNHSSDHWKADIKALRQWIVDLPKPIGIMAANDVRALHVMTACQQLGLIIPDQVAIVGVDDEETLCKFANPPITSILPDCEAIGFQALEMLDAMMSGSGIEATPIKIKPKRIVIRPSTDISSVSDEIVRSAIKKIRRKDASERNINIIAKELKISKNMLDRRFAKSLNRSAADVMRWTLIVRIQQLLLNTDLTLTEIAKLTGFVNSECMNVMFKSNVGVSAGTYRLIHRKKSSTDDSSNTKRSIDWADADFVG